MGEAEAPRLNVAGTRRSRSSVSCARRGTPEAAEELGIRRADLSPLAHQYGGMKADDAKRLKKLERENRSLKAIVADQALEVRALGRSRRETGESSPPAPGGRDGQLAARQASAVACRAAPLLAIEVLSGGSPVSAAVSPASRSIASTLPAAITAHRPRDARARSHVRPRTGPAHRRCRAKPGSEALIVVRSLA